MESSDIDQMDDLEGEVVEGLVEKMDHFGDEVEGLWDEIEGLVDEVENFGDDVESLGNDEIACSVDDDTEGVKDVQMEGKEQEFESTNEKVILQSDTAKNLSGKDMKMFVHQVVSSTGIKLLAFYHNEAAAGKDVCDTHFAHQQARVDAYISEGDSGSLFYGRGGLVLAMGAMWVVVAAARGAAGEVVVGALVSILLVPVVGLVQVAMLLPLLVAAALLLLLVAVGAALLLLLVAVGAALLLLLVGALLLLV
ncbi:hypothetical protein EMCRGX_G031263 [Ephydatia muelleri]